MVALPLPGVQSSPAVARSPRVKPGNGNNIPLSPHDKQRLCLTEEVTIQLDLLGTPRLYATGGVHIPLYLLGTPQLYLHTVQQAASDILSKPSYAGY